MESASFRRFEVGCRSACGGLGGFACLLVSLVLLVLLISLVLLVLLISLVLLVLLLLVF